MTKSEIARCKTFFLVIQFQVDALKALYGKIAIFPKKINAFETWKCGETIPTIARHVRVADATVEIYIIDCIARGQGSGELHCRIVNELGIDQNKFERVQECLTRSGITLREIRDITSLRYNEIRAIIALLINDFEL